MNLWRLLQSLVANVAATLPLSAHKAKNIVEHFCWSSMQRLPCWREKFPYFKEALLFLLRAHQLCWNIYICHTLMVWKVPARKSKSLSKSRNPLETTKSEIPNSFLVYLHCNVEVNIVNLGRGRGRGKGNGSKKERKTERRGRGTWRGRGRGKGKEKALILAARVWAILFEFSIINPNKRCLGWKYF